MMLNSYYLSTALKFLVATMLPVIACTAIMLVRDHPRCKGLGYWTKQVLVGLIFGCIAIFGTEFGIDTLDATMNVRDAAPIAAGLFFGGPAGIIAGLIGGIERWLSVLWGRGTFTRVACSTATCVAGIYAALLRRYIFDERKPSWLMSFAIGAVAEVLHLLLVFLTNMHEAHQAFLVVKACSLPMIGCNALSVALCSVAVALIRGQSLLHRSETPEISRTIQTGMLGVVAMGFALTVGFTLSLQQSLATENTYDTLSLALSDVKADIRDASDENLLSLTRRAAEQIPRTELATDELLASLVVELDVNEVHVIDERGIIVASSDKSTIGFDMASGEQSAEFLVLLPSGKMSYLVQEYQPEAFDPSVWRKFAGVAIEDGFVQTSYDGSRFTDDLKGQIREAVRNRHVGNEGMILVMDENGGFVGSRSGSGMSSGSARLITQTAADAGEGNLFRTSFRSKSYFGLSESNEGFRVVALLPAIEAESARDLSVLLITFMEVLVLAAIFAAIYLLIKRVVVSSIWQVNSTLGQITSGDLEAEVDVRDSAEFALLSDDINTTVAALRDAIAAEAMRNERDLATAKAIQESALPRTFPPFPDIKAFDIYASMNPAREVGGDFYDFFLVDDHTLGFLVADVSGKGIPASLFMMAAKTELANYMGSGMNLADAVKTANWHLCQGNDADMFVTVWAAKLDYRTGELTYVNAGHNFPLLRHEGRWHWLTKRCGLFLGTFEMAKYRQETIVLTPGDVLFLYTDGVNEAFSAAGEEYGNDRLERSLTQQIATRPRAIIEVMQDELNEWARGAEQSDDITMLALAYGIPPEDPR